MHKNRSVDQHPINYSSNFHQQQMRLLYCIILGLFLHVGTFVGAQHLTFISLANDVTVCGAPRAMGVVYQNTSNDTLRSVSVNIQFPGGVNYIPGTLGGNGFAEASISQLDSIILSAPNIPPFQSDTFRILMTAGCDASDSAAVSHFVRVLYSGGGDSLLTDPFSILRPALSIQSISPLSFTGPVGSSFQRCVSVINGGYGELSAFSIVLESSASSLSHANFVLAANGTPIPSTVSGDSIILLISAAQIAAIGDLDTLFEQNEVLEICFQVNVDDCIDLSTDISVLWGCGGQICENQTSTANVVVPALVPNLVVNDYYVESKCYGSGIPSLIKIVLQNNGTGPARDVEIDLWQGEPTGPSNGYISRLDTANIVLKSTLGGITSISPFAVENQAAGTNLGCLGPNPIRRVKVRIPFIQPGERDTVIVEQYTCCKSWCASSPSTTNRTHYQIGYHDRCFTSNYVIPANIVTSWNIGRVLSFTNTGLTDIPLGDTANYEVEHSDFRFFNYASGAYAWVDIVAQPGLTVLSGPGDIFWEDITGDIWNPFNIVVSGDTVRAFFQLPQPPGFTLEKSLLKFRMTNDCSGGPCSSGPKLVQYSIHEVPDTNCTCEAIIGCHNFTVNSHCGICPATCTNGGMIFLRFDSYRKNYGLPDNDNNGIPDGSGSINPNLVRRQHLMLRDTLHTQFSGVVQTTITNPNWAEGIARSVMTRGNVLTAVRYSIRIVDASAGAIYTSALPAPTISTSGTTRTFTYSLNTAGLTGTVPPGFTFEVNDSVQVVAEYVVSANPGSIVEPQTITNTFAMQSGGGSLTAGCDNYSGSFVLVGYYYTSSGPDEFSVSGCNTVTVTENYYLSIGNCCSNYAGGNIFDYEYRHWGIPSQGRFVVPSGYSFVSATMRHYRTAGTGASNNVLVPLTPTSISNDTIYFNLASQFVSNGGSIPLGDDGYVGTINVTLRPSCGVLPDILQPVRYLWNFSPIPGLTGSGSVNPASSRVDSIAYEAPSLIINPVLPTAQGISSTVAWEFNLENNSNTAGAGNTWFSLESPSGQITITSVEDLRSGLFLTPVGGLYQIGTLPQDSSWGYRVTADYNNCQIDSLQILAGWDCNVYPPTVSAYPCTPQESWLYIQPQQAILQASLATDPGPHDICDSMLVELQVVSSQTADLKDISVNVRLPLSGGLTFAPGSGEMQYPTTASFSAIPDPVIVGNQFTWDINTINALIAANDLPGTTRPDSNVFNLRFYLYTNCDMISGDRFRVRIEALQGCGDPAVPLLLLSNPILISGAVQPYVTQVTAQQTQVSTCPLRQEMEVTIIHAGLAASNPGDSIFVNLSPGYAFAGNFAGITNPPSTSTPDQLVGPGGVRLGWEMPAGLSAGDTVRFRFEVLVGDAVPCGPDVSTVQAVTNQTLFCARTSSICSASTQTGSATISGNITRPDLDFTAFNSTIQPVAGGYNYLYNGTLSNTGTPLPGGSNTIVQFYCDNDNSGDYTPGDVALGTYSTSVGISSGTPHNFSGGFFIPNGSCSPSNIILGMVVPNSAGGYCICDSVEGNSNVVLPTQWLSVQARALAEANLVQWHIADQQSARAFVVEHRIESGWQPVSPSLPSQHSNDYQWQHLDPRDQEFYRIRTILIDGTTLSSEVVEVQRGISGNSFHAWPNPARNWLNLSAPLGTAYHLSNAIGQIVHLGAVSEAGVTGFSVSNLPSGVYFLKFQWQDTQIVQRIVIQPAP